MNVGLTVTLEITLISALLHSCILVGHLILPWLLCHFMFSHTLLLSLFMTMIMESLAAHMITQVNANTDTRALW